MVRIVASSAGWPARFAGEAARLKAAFGPRALRIDHVGSTAVPGLAAKPVIDIQVSVPALLPREPLVRTLARLGYAHIELGDFDRVYPFFQRPGPTSAHAGPGTHHVHLCVSGSPQEHDHLVFRDALRASPPLARSYEALKRQLAARHHGATLASREAYSLAKSDFIGRVLAGRFAGRVCSHDSGHACGPGTSGALAEPGGAMPPWRFRAATPDDAEVLAALRVEAMRPSLEQAGRFDPERARDRFLSRFEPRWTRWIEWAGAAAGRDAPSPMQPWPIGGRPGEPAGFVVLRPDDDAPAPVNRTTAPCWLLDHFYLRPVWQGGGLGSAVLRAVLAETDLAGHAVRVGALRGSPANAFYRRHGFQPLAESAWDVYHLRPPSLSLPMSHPETP